MTDFTKTLANAGGRHAQREVEAAIGQPEGYYSRLVASIQETKKATEAGSVADMTMFGQFYYTGVGTDKNPQQAVFWLKKAAKRQDHVAMYHLGQIYSVEYSDRLHEAKALIEKAMALGPIPGVTEEEAKAMLSSVEAMIKHEELNSKPTNGMESRKMAGQDFDAPPPARQSKTDGAQSS